MMCVGKQALQQHGSTVIDLEYMHTSMSMNNHQVAKFLYNFTCLSISYIFIKM